MTVQEEYRKFNAANPEAQREFRTIELFHRSFTQLHRLVSDAVERDLTLESMAPRNANQTVTFLPLDMKISEPNEQDMDSLLTVNMGAVAGLIQSEIDRIQFAGTGTIPVQIIYRKFYSGDTSEPVKVLTLSVKSVVFEGFTKTAITAEDSDLENKASGLKYTIDQFPMLEGL